MTHKVLMLLPALAVLACTAAARADESAALEQLRRLGASARVIEVGQTPYVEVVIVADQWHGRDDDLRLLAEVNRPLTVDLSRASITPAGVARLRGAGQLTKLHLAGATLGDDVLREIGSLSTLKVLSLDNAQFDNASLAHLAGLKQLQSLLLSQSSIDDTGLAHLAQLKQLQLVMLLRSRVTEEGVARLRKALPDASIVR